MSWSLTLARVAGIQIRVHVTFVLILLWVAWLQLSQGATGSEVAWSLVFVGLVFGCVVLHELGHALMALRFGIRTRDIVLLPIGGVARLERMPKEPARELAIAIAGPAVNVAIALVLGLGLAATGRSAMMADTTIYESWSVDTLVPRLVGVNLFLVAFNLLPAFPMDGGRVLRALLGFVTNHVRATQLASRIGRMMALVFAFVGLTLPQPMLLLIAVFVWIGATQESNALTFDRLMAGEDVRSIMIRDFETLPFDAALQDAIDLTLNTEQTDFPVMENGRVVGVLGQKELLRGLSSVGSQGRASELMRTQFPTTDVSTDAKQLLERMAGLGADMVVVESSGRPVGLVTLQNIREALAINLALESAPRRPTAAEGKP